MTKRLWTCLALALSIFLPAMAQPPAPTGKVDPGEPKNQPQVAHDHDGDGVPDHPAEAHGEGEDARSPWDGATGPAVVIVAGLGVLGLQRAISARRRTRTPRPSSD